MIKKSKKEYRKEYYQRPEVKKRLKEWGKIYRHKPENKLRHKLWQRKRAKQKAVERNSKCLICGKIILELTRTKYCCDDCLKKGKKLVHKKWLSENRTDKCICGNIKQSISKRCKECYLKKGTSLSKMKVRRRYYEKRKREKEHEKREIEREQKTSL